MCRKSVTFVFTDRDCRNPCVVTNGHGDLAKNVVVNDNGNRTCFCGKLYFFFKGDIASLNECDLTVHIKAGIVDLHTYAGDGNVLVCYVIPLCNAKHCKEVVFLSCGVNRRSKEDFILAIGKHIIVFFTANGCNRHCRCVGGGRTYGSGIGIIGLVGVTLLRTKTTAVIVGSRNYQRNTCLLDSAINLVLIHLIGSTLISEAAGGTETHIDSVNAKNNGVLKSRNDIALFCPLVVVTKDLHNSKLCIDSNTGDLVILTRNNAGYVSTVAIFERHNVRILVGVVIAKRDLIAGNVTVVNFSCFEVGCKLLRFEILFFEKVCDHITVIIRLLDLITVESGVRIITAGIKNGNNGSLTGVVNTAAVEDTGFVNVNGIFNRCRRQVGVGDHNSLNAFYRTDLFNHVVGGLNKSTVGNMYVVVADVVNQSLCHKLIEHLVLVGGKLVGIALGCRGILKLLVSHLTCVFRSCVSSYEGVIGKGNDQANSTAKFTVRDLLNQILVKRLDKILF